MTDKIRHRLLAILAADAAGYSRLMSVDDMGTLDALETARNTFRHHVEAEDGRIVDTSGDSVLAVFDTAAGAVRAALLIQGELRERAEGLPQDRRLLFRVGIHLGDIVEKEDGTVYGDGVNIASRLQALAEPGAIVVSHAVEETASHHAQFDFKDIGEQRVKNIAKPVRAYRLSRPIDTAASRAPRPRGAASNPEPGRPHAAHRWRTWLATGVILVGAALFAVGAALRWQPSAPSVNIDEEVMARRALAVLAFNDRRQNPDSASFGDDLADAIGVQLQRNGMRVIQRSSTRTQNPAAPEFERIGVEQHVKFVLNGRITQSGESVRVATNLTEISTGAVYRLLQADLRPTDDLGLARYARLVAAALKARYFEIETTNARQPGREKDPVDAIVLALRDLDRGGPDDLQSARHRFEFAVNADPYSLDAVAGLGVAHLTELYYFYSPAPRDKLNLAEQVLKRGLDLSQDNPHLLAAWAEVLMLQQQPEQSLWMWTRSLEANPDDQGAHLHLAGALVRQGRFAEAEQHVAQASELRPLLARDQQWLNQVRADLAFAQQRDDEAYEILRNWSAAYPNSGRPYLMLAAIDALHGRMGAARINMARARQMLPLGSVAYVELVYPSSNPDFLAQRARLIDGLRKAGLPEGDR